MSVIIVVVDRECHNKIFITLLRYLAIIDYRSTGILSHTIDVHQCL